MVGLTKSEVEQRVANGQTNKSLSKITKSNFAIFRDNVLTLFNLYNCLIAVALLAVGAWTNILFLLVLLLNITIGIIQEVKGRNLVNKLSLLNKQKIKVLRDGQEALTPDNELVLDDVVILSLGCQIPTDGTVLDGAAEVNESLLTGESDAILKTKTDKVLAGSFVTSGNITVKVDKVGGESFANKLAQEAKVYKQNNSQLLKSMRLITKFTSFLIIPIGALLFVLAFVVRQEGIYNSILTTSAALLGMLPRGLVLLISIALATGVVKLGKKRVLIQEPFAIETMARCGIICLDKTGTLTEGKIKVSDILYDAAARLPMAHEKLLSVFANLNDDENATAKALKDYFCDFENSFTVSEKIPFSSERKWAALSIANVGTVVLGAAERLVKDISKLPAEFKSKINSGERVLAVGFTSDKIANNILPELQIFSLIVLSDPIRKDAKATLDYFKSQGVKVKIISGDNPFVVSRIAKQAGLESYDKFIDMSTVETDVQLHEAAKNYSIFGRVTPKQKKQLVIAFKELEKEEGKKRNPLIALFKDRKQGNKVAFCGDGVNDVLALKEADCSIAIGNGSSAAKQVSQIVLTDGDFASLPDIVNEGRRVVHNVTKVAAVFFIKTIYSVLLSVLFIIINAPFPFIPITITMIDLALEGFPAFCMNFENDRRPIKGTFLNTAFTLSAPFAITITLAVSILVILQSALGSSWGIDGGQLMTIMYFMIGFITVLAVIRACLPFNKLRVFVASFSSVGYIALIAGLMIIGYYFPSFDLLHLTPPPLTYWWLIAVFFAASIILCTVLIYFLSKRDKEKSPKPLSWLWE